MHLAVEGPDRGVKVVAMANAEVIQRQEEVRVEPGNETEDVGLHVVHLGRVVESDPVVVRRALLETLEGSQHLGAVVSLGVVLGDGDAKAFDAEQISDLRQTLFHAFDISAERGERRGLYVVREVLPKAFESFRFEFDGRERASQGHDRVVVDLGRVDEPALFLVLIAERVRLLEMCAHVAHLLDERRDRLEHGFALEIPEHFLAIGNRVGVIEMLIEEGRQVVLLIARRNRAENLVKVEIGKVPRLRPFFSFGRVRRSVEENAAKRLGGPFLNDVWSNTLVSFSRVFDVGCGPVT